jgi:ribulose-phosphate 3-epimerase
MRLSPSLLAADLADLGGAVAACEAGGADLVHLDVMDGQFVPNLTLGVPVAAALARRTRLPLDVHLMIAQPERLAEEFLAAGAAWLTVHWEAAAHLHRLLELIRGRGARAGVALNPATPVELLVDVLPNADYVLIMSVDPGFAGQRFIPGALDKARRLRALVRARGLRVEIGMDGGLGRDNIRQAVDAGVEVCVVGSAIFSRPDPVAEMLELRRRTELERA